MGYWCLKYVLPWCWNLLPWSLALGPWSLILSPWSLLPGPWSLVLAPCYLDFLNVKHIITTIALAPKSLVLGPRFLGRESLVPEPFSNLAGMAEGPTKN